MRHYFTHLKEASRQKKSFCLVHATQATEKFLKVLLRLGLIYSFGRKGRKFQISLKPRCLDELKFYPLDRSFFFHKKLDWRRYHTNIQSTQLWLISTDQGILTNEECKKRSIGGRVICSIIL